MDAAAGSAIRDHGIQARFADGVSLDEVLTYLSDRPSV